MSKRGENIRRRKDGRWEARFKTGSRNDGTPIYTSVYGKTYKEAKEKKQLALSTPIRKANHCAMSFGDVQRLWAAQNGVHIKASTTEMFYAKMRIPECVRIPGFFVIY